MYILPTKLLPLGETECQLPVGTKLRMGRVMVTHSYNRNYVKTSKSTITHLQMVCRKLHTYMYIIIYVYVHL